VRVGTSALSGHALRDLKKFNQSRSKM